jgi:hypothetical protein
MPPNNREPRRIRRIRIRNRRERGRVERERVRVEREIERERERERDLDIIQGVADLFLNIDNDELPDLTHTDVSDNTYRCFR